MANLWRLSTGSLFNHLTRIADAQVTMTPAALSQFGKQYAYDEFAQIPARFSSGANDSTFAADLDLYRNDGAFETDLQAAAWTMLGVGTIARSTLDPNTGTGHAAVTPVSAPSAIAYKDISVRAGERLVFTAAAQVDTADNAKVRVRNRATGNWLQSDGSWSASSDDLLDETGSWSTLSPLQFTVESLDLCLRDEVLLRTYLVAEGGIAYFDDVYMYPSLDWCSVHGHNIPPCIVPTLQYSDDNSSWSTASVMTLWRDSFYVKLGSLQDHRYWRLLLDGQPDTGALMYLGEVVFAQSFELLKNAEFGGQIVRHERQTRRANAAGSEFVHLHNAQPQRALIFSFAFKTDERYEQFRDAIFRRCRGGANLIVIAPLDIDDKTVILGRIQDTSTIVKSSVYPRAGELEIMELALPDLSDAAAESVGAYDAPIEEDE
jgi:hypothetical protein